MENWLSTSLVEACDVGVDDIPYKTPDAYCLLRARPGHRYRYKNLVPRQATSNLLYVIGVCNWYDSTGSQGGVWAWGWARTLLQETLEVRTPPPNVRCRTRHLSANPIMLKKQVPQYIQPILQPQPSIVCHHGSPIPNLLTSFGGGRQT